MNQAWKDYGKIGLSVVILTALIAACGEIVVKDNEESVEKRTRGKINNLRNRIHDIDYYIKKHKHINELFKEVQKQIDRRKKFVNEINELNKEREKAGLKQITL